MGIDTTASVAKARASGAVALNPISTATSARQTSVVGHPAITKSIDARANEIAALTPLSAAMRRERYNGVRHWREAWLPARRASRLPRTSLFLWSNSPVSQARHIAVRPDGPSTKLPEGDFNLGVALAPEFASSSVITCSRERGAAVTGNVSSARAVASSATRSTAAARAAALLACPLLDSVARLAISGRRAVISRSSPAAVVAGMVWPRTVLWA